MLKLFAWLLLRLKFTRGLLRCFAARAVILRIASFDCACACASTRLRFRECASSASTGFSRSQLALCAEQRW